MPYADKEAQRKYQLDRYHKIRSSWFNEHGPCRECGSWENLHAHHKNSGEKISHRVWSWSKKRREEELSKCVVLCCPCHGKTRKKPLVHGTPDGYTHHKCRCSLCREALMTYRRNRKNNKVL
jgi:hypothetical protein